MTTTQLFVGSLSALSIGLQLWKGRRPERIAALAFLIAMSATPLVDGFELNGLRWGVGLVSVSLFGALVWLSLTADRWWLLAAAGVQLLVIATYPVALFTPDGQLWASTTFRIVVWIELMLIGLIGVWECRVAPYAQPRPAGC
jgi:hypothetical protein